ncbi:hypothetical protein H6P81_018769 [Aristolochia fimbriata]|uniref:non-specific serine/threonine protein kinase n=1 Tax=Aristolochia fimbriata TaxID=158543 RepID=A0AAV7E468_ARIFI|nr:hypothetical protein H6P81_018769 [Aristolochia fimbriata]
MATLLLPFLISFLLLSLTFSASAQKQTEIQALTSFKLGLEDPLGALAGWDPSTPFAPCDWRGIVCSGNGTVRELRLPRLRLAGPLSPHLSNLPDLRKLSLRSNRLNGSIPYSLSRLTRLRALFLQSNSLSGPLPPNISNLGSLQILNLAQNLLSGAISNIVFPSSIRYLDLSSNAFSGEIPNNLSASPALQLINVSFNRLRGGVPASFGELQALQYLWLDWNLLDGTLPSAIANCSSLLHLSLQGNSLRGRVPAAIGALPSLQVLSLSQNNLSGPLPASLFYNASGSAPNSLRIVQLGFNAFTEMAPPEQPSFSSVLQVLDLQQNMIRGEFPRWLINVPTLRILDLSGNSFTGPLPSKFGDLFALQQLRLARNSLQGEVPANILKCRYLQVLDLEDNRFSGEIPEFIGQLADLKNLSLGGNFFTGQIPASYGNLSKLEALSLRQNNLKGSVSTELIRLNIGNCSGLTVLELRSNRLTGQIPTSFSRLSHLQKLDLGNNLLIGKIPPEIANFSSLITLRLDKNHLSGVILDFISDLSNLQILDLSSNNFTGAIPANLSLIPRLAYLNVSNNNLEGEIPRTLAFRFNNPSLFSMNQHLCGKPLSRKCENAPKKGKSKKKKKVIVLLGIAAGVAVLAALCCCCYIISLLRWRKRLQEGGEKKKSPARGSSGANSGAGDNGNGGPKLVMFNNKITYAETLEATRQFDEENVLSRGRYGVVFKACFQDGTVLSIRRLPDCSVEERAFRKDAELLGKVKHRNLTVLRGYYTGPPDIRLLVYDYMPNGNLATLLQEASHQDGHVLNWPMRHLIALGVARGLAFLHTVAMVHGDIKPQNILFDADFEAHLSDFGLDKLAVATPAEASTSATPVGTLGYVSPEAILTGQTSKESDVYSFGIVLLELLTGKRPVMFTGEDEDIVKWVKRLLQRGQVSELLEPGLLELDPESSEWEEFLLGVKVGLLCTAPDPLDRPSMADIVFMLEGCRVGADIPSSADPTSQPSPA